MPPTLHLINRMVMSPGMEKEVQQFLTDLRSSWRTWYQGSWMQVCKLHQEDRISKHAQVTTSQVTVHVALPVPPDIPTCPRHCTPTRYPLPRSLTPSLHGTPRKWNYTLCILLHWVSFTHHFLCDIHPCCHIEF